MQVPMTAPAPVHHRPPAGAPPAAAGKPYHHGNLRTALVTAGLELAREGGPDAVVLRAVSRLAGVSHSAGYRHFADQGELLREVARRCMAELAELMRVRADAVPAGDPVWRAWARLDAIGRAYVEFAITEPGWFRTTFAVQPEHPLDGGTEPLLHEGGPRPADPPDASHELSGPPESLAAPFATLSARLDDLVAVGALPASRRAGAEFAAWSVVHGLATLLVDGPLRGAPPAMVEHALGSALGVVARGL
ncbi:MAG: TetR/AcrR family transcriptional regulator [Kineosporiaceae bacterium]